MSMMVRKNRTNQAIRGHFKPERQVKLERVDKILCIREEQNGVLNGQDALSQHLHLREPKDLVRRLGNAFPGFFINDKGAKDDKSG